jgi:quercetin dioxygenase-like cupin family protein
MGQALHVLTGVGRVHLAGRPPQIITAGDSVWIEASERHWHGADAGHTMVHLAIQETDQNGVSVMWLEHVSEEDNSAVAERS